jgi:nucleotide-binding universal stress UspA family protein
MYRALMVPLDGSSLGEYALPFALGIARREGAALDLVHVCTPLGANAFGGELDAPVLDETRRAQLRSRARVYLDQIAGRLSACWKIAITVTLLDGPAVEMLHDHALASGADLVVMTTHGRSPLARAWMGSVADKLARRLPMPILLARPHEQALNRLEVMYDRTFEHVLIPLDGSALAEEILEPAIALGALMCAEYTLLQAIEVPVLGYAPAAQVAGLEQQVLEQCRAQARAYVDRVAGRMRAHGLVVHTHVTSAPPALAIVDEARRHAADLIALSTHGRGGLARMLLGSVADTVVRWAGVPVLLQRPRGEVVPVAAVADLVEASHAQ